MWPQECLLPVVMEHTRDANSYEAKVLHFRSLAELIL